MNFVKHIKALIAVTILLAIILLTGCSGDKSLSPSEIVNDIYKDNGFSSMSELSGDKLSAYFTFSNTDVKRFCVMISTSGENADVIASFEYNDSASRLLVVNGISQYLSNRASSFKNNLTAEYDKIQNRILMDVGNTVTLVISSKSSDIQAQLTKIGGVSIS